MTAATTTRLPTVPTTARAADDDTVTSGVVLDAAGLVSWGFVDEDTARFRRAGHVTVDLTVSYDSVRRGGCGRREPSRDLG